MTSRRVIISAVVALAIVALVPTTAFAALLINDYGLSFAGQEACLGCHEAAKAATTHGNFTKASAEPTPGAPNMWPVQTWNGQGLRVNAADVAFTLGAGIGLREYLGYDAARSAVDGKVFLYEGMEWFPESNLWELSATGIERANYGCGQCHQLGVTRSNATSIAPRGNMTVGAGPNTPNSWARFDLAQLDPAALVPGMSIQCERCHGTGVAATTANGGHKGGAPVKIVGYGSTSAASKRILDSEVCGQCHGTLNSGQNTLGYTPDRKLSEFATLRTTVPTEGPFLANPGGFSFYPTGANKGMKHSYYNEWLVSGHSVKGQLANDAADASPYQKTGAARFSDRMATASAACLKCHTGEGYLIRKLGTENGIMEDAVLSTATTGFYGQECVICHDPHKSDGTGLAVRTPDAANGPVGSSTSGLATGNTSICEDCHNWQAEVQGSLPSIGGRVSHPQRETLHGRGLSNFVDIADAAEFMPGTSCNECHMPVTRTDFPDVENDMRYGDRSLKRYSHRMLPMLPGEAEDWNVREFGDSCTPCHTGTSRADLQTSIDGWQAATTAKLNAAIAARDAARLRAASATSDLEDRATSVINWVNGDASVGAHNPPYIAAALDKAVLYSRAVGARFSALYGTGSPMFVGGTLVDGAGVGIAGQTVRIYAGTTLRGTAVTDASGKFAVMTPAMSNFTARWEVRPGVFVSLNKTVTTIRRSASPILLGRTVTISGAVTPRSAGNVYIYGRRSTSRTFTRLATVRLSSSSTYARAIRPTARGTWYYYAQYAGSSASLSSKSAVVSVVVR